MTVTYNCKVLFDGKAINQKIERRIDTVQAKLDSQVMKDSNYYCPMQQGILKSSVIIASKLGNGLLEWNTPYARRQYYECPVKRKNKNPNATMKWFESAKARWKKAWEKLANEEYCKASK